jgi:hypothetical protein
MKQAFVFVALMAITSFAHSAGFDDNYTAVLGDFGNDGDQDLYLRHTPEIVFVSVGNILTPIITSPRQVGQFVLENDGSGGLSITPLSSSEISGIQQWTPTDVRVSLVDMNFDGTLDAFIHAGEVIANATSVLVLASSDSGAMPLHAALFNANTQLFYSDIWDWFVAPLVTATQSVPEYTYIAYQYGQPSQPAQCLFYEHCGYWIDDLDDPGGWDPFDDPNIDNVIHWWGWDFVQQLVTYRDFQPSHPWAGLFTQILDDVWDAGAIEAGSFEAGVVAGLFNATLGYTTVNFDQEDDEVDPDLDDEWRHKRVLEEIAKVALEVCLDGPGEALECLTDMLAPGLPHLQSAFACIPYNFFQDYSITTNQATYVNNQQRREFWLSRWEDSCDPFAPAAIGVVDETGLGAVTMKWLRAVTVHEGVTIDEQQIGIEIMEAHADVTTQDNLGVIDHLLSPRQITDYHAEVFNEHSLPDSTFGGAPLGTDRWWGVGLEKALGYLVWCHGCDLSP